eukprot:m.28309 g.28309  ORF g.28309 m.28309 type:complete len:832 (+) comp9075_c0_seq1:33-2528(+)
MAAALSAGSVWSVVGSSAPHIWEAHTHHRSELCGFCNAKFTRHQRRPLQCTLCHMRAHGDCADKGNGQGCRPTFVENTGQPQKVHHHWINGLYEQKKVCDVCSRSIGQVMSTTLAKRCSWCKRTRHLGCTTGTETCDLGPLAPFILPPSSIVAVRPAVANGSEVAVDYQEPFERNKQLRKHSRTLGDMVHMEVRPVPGTTPLLVFVNPRSGGNQGVRLLQEFQWHLNPRQVFDLMAPDPDKLPERKPSGPRLGLEMFKSVPGLRVLVCGGDGTVGWVLQAMDQAGLSAPVCMLPLGTGNDLAREFDWGGGYTGTPLFKILTRMLHATTEPMDRWNVSVAPAPGPADFDDVKVVDKLSQTIMNNYFSIGSDALTALRFHLKREAKPESFDSRLRNKAHYGLLGAKELIQHRFRNLSREIRLICDGEDKTALLVARKIEAVTFLNISSYAGGTRPWGTRAAAAGFDPPSLCDRRLEVVGFEDGWDMAKSQMGLGHALRIAQCSTATIIMSRALPVQIDGEPCVLAPSTITITHKNQVLMVRDRARGSAPESAAHSDANPSEDDDGEVVVVDEPPRALAETPNPPDDDEFKTIDVIFVPLQGDRSGMLRRLGLVTLPLDIPLVDARSHLSSQLHVSLRHSAGWRFLKFCCSPDAPESGSYYVVTIAEELSLRVRVFALPLESTRPGLYVCQLPNHVDTEETSVEGFLNACVEGSVERARELLHDGVAVDCRDDAGRNGMHLAAMHNRLGVVLLLLRQFNVRPDALDDLGRTALHLAAQMGHERICECLLEANASTTIADRQGKLAETLAREARHDEVVRLFALHNAEADQETIV